MCIILAVTAAYFLTLQKHTDAAPKAVEKTGAAVPSEFKTKGVDGWWQGATNKTSMVLFQNSHDCFVSAQHDAGSVDIPIQLEKQRKLMTDAGYTFTELPTIPMTIQTSSGQLAYDLYQFAADAPANADPIMKGQAYGYIPLTNGYIKVFTDCNTPEQLPSTITAFQSLLFNGTR